MKLQLVPAANSVSASQSLSPLRVPNTSSTRLVIFTGTVLVFLTVKVKVTSAPVKTTRVGFASLVTSIAGRTSSKVTVSSSVSLAGLPSVSAAVTLNVLTWVEPVVPLSVVV